MLKFLGFLFLFLLSECISDQDTEKYVEYEKSQMRDCFGNYKNYKELLETTDTEDRDQLELIYRSCWNIRVCLTAHGYVVKDFLEPVRWYCSLVKFVLYEQCYKDLQAKNSICFKNWRPLISTKLTLDLKRSESCRNSFGENSCMKEEITAVCGRYQWETFRDHYSGLGNGTVAWKDCERLEVINDLLKNLIDWKDEHEDDDAVFPDEQEEPKS
ncbi:unnamed protein product [Caenorhabditis nigoni]